MPIEIYAQKFSFLGTIFTSSKIKWRNYHPFGQRMNKTCLKTRARIFVSPPHVKISQRNEKFDLHFISFPSAVQIDLYGRIFLVLNAWRTFGWRAFANGWHTDTNCYVCHMFFFWTFFEWSSFRSNPRHTHTHQANTDRKNVLMFH